MKCNEMQWNEMQRSEMKWNAMECNEIIIYYTYEMCGIYYKKHIKRSKEKEWNETKLRCNEFWI